MTVRKLNRPFTFNNDFDHFFNDFFSAPTAAMKEGKKRFFGEVPAVNIGETEHSYDIEVAAPGMKKVDFKIEIDQGIMSISAESENESTEKNEKFSRREFNYSTFERRFTLPENVEEKKVKATYEDGILKIGIPKTREEEKEEKKRLIPIS